MLATAVCVSLLIACGSSSKHSVEPPNPATQEATVDKAVEMFVAIGEVVMSAKSNCDAMAMHVDAWITANGDEHKKVNATLMRIQRQEMKKRYREGLSARLHVVLGMKVGLEGCQGHARFMAVWNRFGR